MERDQASKFVNDLLKLLVTRKGSDLFLTADFPPAIKVDGKVTKVSPQPLTGSHTVALARAIMNDKQAADFERTKECNFAISPQGIGRFRVSAFMQQGHVGMVLRTIPAHIPTVDELSLPKVLKDIAMAKRGLVILVGGTGSGKSTSLAAMVDWRNEHSVDLSCNLFYMSRSTPLGLRYIPKIYRYLAAPARKIIEMTRNGIFEVVYETKAERDCSYSKAVAECRKAQYVMWRAKRLIQRGWFLKGKVLTDDMFDWTVEAGAQSDWGERLERFEEEIEALQKDAQADATQLPQGVRDSVRRKLDL